MRTRTMIVITILIALLVLIFFTINLPRPRRNQPVACTADAKICPDGSAVGRVGPNCEFAPCPGE